MQERFDTIVIGAGASGIAAAIAAAESHESVLLVEKGERIGRKILASGNGRCNLLNAGPLRYHGNSAFTHRVFARFSQQNLVCFWKRYGLVMAEEAEGRFYPASFHSATVLSVLKHALELRSVQVCPGFCIVQIRRNEDHSFTCMDLKGCSLTAGRVIVTTGGPAQPKLGGCDDGYALLRSFGHTLVEPFPALVPVLTDPKSVSGLSGIRVRCTVTLFDQQGPVHCEQGELLFTDYGISGICVMQCARYLQGRNCYFEIDFLAGPPGEADCTYSELKRLRAQYASFDPVTLLDGWVHAKVSYAILKQARIPLRGEKLGDLTDDDLHRIYHTARHYRIGVLGTKGFDSAQVAAGGISSAEFCPDTMESFLCPGLFAAGEVLDVDGECGGFNLMFAFASGIIAGSSGTASVHQTEGDSQP